MSNDIFKAAAEGNLPEIRRLLSNGANPNDTDGNSTTPIHFAASTGQLEAVKILLSAGANPDPDVISTPTPLAMAASGGHDAVIRLLLPLTPEKGLEELRIQACKGNLPAIRSLIAAGVNPNGEHELGITPLSTAVSGGQTEAVKVLLEAGANPNVTANLTTIDGWDYSTTPLSKAKKNGHREIVRLLKAHGALDRDDDDSIGHDNGDEVPTPVRGIDEPNISHDQFSPPADDTPLANSFRYLLMRIARLILTVVCEVGMIAMSIAFAYMLFTGFLSIIFPPSGVSWRDFAYVQFGRPQPWKMVIIAHPFIWSVVTGAAAIFMYSMSLASGIPHRIKTFIPGGRVAICDSCHAQTADDWSCSACKADRPERLGTWLCDKANSALNVVWILHDVAFAILTFGLSR